MRRRGFTLIEVLVGAVIGTVVMGLAIESFSQLMRALAQARSRTEASRYATNGLGRLSELVRRGNIFFYAARPMQTQVAVVSGRADAPAPRAALPGSLEDLGRVGPTFQIPVNDALRTEPSAWISSPSTSKRSFRFTFPTGDRAGGGEPSFSLRIAPAKNTADPTLNRFPGPLAYFAEAEFIRTKTGDTSNPYALLPRSWTFYVLYLAPMRLPPNDANWSMPREPRDHFPAPIPAGISPARTAVPYELRLLTIPGVRAGASQTGAYTVTTADTGLATHQATYDPEVGRVLAPGATLPDQAFFLEPPFDYDGRTANGRANYDPVPVRMTDPPAARLDPNSLNNLFRFQAAAGVTTARPPSGPRIAGEGLHSNFGMLGNDPPTEQALQVRPGAPVPTDVLLVPYIDPDAYPGTSCRFVNNLHSPPAAAGVDGTIPLGGGRFYHRYIEMNGPGCDYLENRVLTLRGDPGSTSFELGAYGTVPSRALISVTTRYRSRRDVPFQFATLQTEVSLDGLAQYARLRSAP
ncbi:MAG: prepilin-type N-terminal cleavage/methylation domain-containing protein [Candidatus Sericytochromatia bacterium]|nr:prepilin-type N-terminal cleavage/methylation domain-containing protein [Candidatus Sericytochromatia bacterium]